MPNKPTLIKAVSDLLKVEFLPNNVKFSAHDVTARLRELVVQQGAIGSVYPIDTLETGTVMVQGHKVARIEHSDVRQIVHELFDAGQLKGYGREQSGQYFEYSPDFSSLATEPPPHEEDPTPIGPNTGPWSSLSSI